MTAAEERTPRRTVEWVDRGRIGCKGNARTERLPDGRIRTTCDRCTLDWYLVQK